MLGPGTLPSHFLLLLVMVDAKDGTVVISHHLLSFPENTLPPSAWETPLLQFSSSVSNCSFSGSFSGISFFIQTQVPQDVVTV